MVSVSNTTIRVNSAVFPGVRLEPEVFSDLGKPGKREAYFNTKQYLRVFPESAKSENTRKPKKTKKLLSQRLNSRYQSRTRLSRLYSELGNQKKSARVNKCSSFFNVLTCGEHIQKRVASFRCNNRLCPDCASRRGNRLFFEYEPIINAYLSENPDLSVLHLVLTQAQKQGETVKQSHKRLRASIKRLVDRKFWKDSFAGSLNSYEFTISTRTFADGAIHYHGHLLVFCKLKSSQRDKDWLSKFRAVWLAVSKGENKNLRVVPVTNLQKGLAEILTYVIKPLDIQKLSAVNLFEVEELHKHKMFATTGDFHKFVKAYRKAEKEAQKEAEIQPTIERETLKAGDTCPDCEKPLYELQMPIKQLIIFAQDIERQRKE
jgi:plasmid rolling circle replication initiator protein Rep